jgi:hypothetical protein
VDLRAQGRHFVLLRLELFDPGLDLFVAHGVALPSPRPRHHQVIPAPALPDFDELAARLVQLRHREAESVRRLAKEQERHGQFPTDFSEHRLTELRKEAEALRAEIEELEAQLRPVLRRRDEE